MKKLPENQIQLALLSDDELNELMDACFAESSARAFRKELRDSFRRKVTDKLQNNVHEMTPKEIDAELDKLK